MGQRHLLRPVRARSRPCPLRTGPYVVFQQQSGRYSEWLDWLNPRIRRLDGTIEAAVGERPQAQRLLSYPGVAVELDAGNRIFTTLPVVLVQR